MKQWVVASAVVGVVSLGCGDKIRITGGLDMTTPDPTTPTQSGDAGIPTETPIFELPPTLTPGEDDAGTPPVDPVCGDGRFNQNDEECDDGNNDSGDGCSVSCALETDFACPNPGEPCVSTVECGDSLVTGLEQCDDGNTSADDGCDDECQLETGWVCLVPGLRCQAAECGDELVVAFEECDDGNAVSSDGCSEVCRLEEGFKCDTPGEACEPTLCFDGATEGTEQCDDANYNLGDGCTPFCRIEPECSQGPCTSACGDGIRFVEQEECDDGNSRNGDGCSADCEVEQGFVCREPNTLPPTLQLPLVLRDFLPNFNPATGDNNLVDLESTVPQRVEHPDFEREDAINDPTGSEDGATDNPPFGLSRIVRSTGATVAGTERGADLGEPALAFAIKDHVTDLPGPAVSLAGKPVYFDVACNRTVTVGQPLPGPAAKCTLTTLDADSFHQWFTDGPWTTSSVETLNLALGSIDALGAFTPGGTAYFFNSRYMTIDDAVPPFPPVAFTENGTNVPVALDGFFPLDPGATGISDGVVGFAFPHNFHFTSEVRNYFQYDAANPPTLTFSGDDDVWVYVNGFLALDLGGIHGRIEGSFTIDAANAALWHLQEGSIYEIAVFQAERNQSRSNYWLTLDGFFAPPSECTSICGDGIIASDELCDDGPDGNDGAPGNCGPDCRSRGPFCGDNSVSSANDEECDDGVNLTLYDFDQGMGGCGRDCKLPPYCGDADVQGAFEDCDEGADDNDGRYEGCNPDCTPGPRCGDNNVDEDEGETCDDGDRVANDGCDSRCQREITR